MRFSSVRSVHSVVERSAVLLAASEERYFMLKIDSLSFYRYTFLNGCGETRSRQRKPDMLFNV